MRSRRCKDERTSKATGVKPWEGEASNDSEPEELPESTAD